MPVDKISKKIVGKRGAFTLAEILITLGVIGVIAAITVPNLIEQSQERQWVAGLLKFNSTLQQAVQLWKQDIGCDDTAYNCLASQNLTDGACSNFNQLAKFFKVSQYAAKNANSIGWLPDLSYNYYGDVQTSGNSYGDVSNQSELLCRYSLHDGATLGVDTDATAFNIFVDVNGKRPPNRHGKDIYTFVVGGPGIKKDLSYFPMASETVRHTEGLCSLYKSCDPNNTDPGVGNGASPTAYVILNHKIPDFKALAAKYPGTFKP